MALNFPSTMKAETNDPLEIQKADFDLLDKINQVAAAIPSSGSNSTENLTLGTASYTNTQLESSTANISVDWSKSDLFNLPALTQSITLTFTNLRVGTIRLVVPHATSAVTYTVTFPVSYKIGTDGPSAYAYSLVGSTTARYTTFDVFYDGARIYVFEGKFHA